jgi:hypothetical protein
MGIWIGLKNAVFGSQSYAYAAHFSRAALYATVWVSMLCAPKTSDATCRGIYELRAEKLKTTYCLKREKAYYRYIAENDCAICVLLQLFLSAAPKAGHFTL